MKPKAEINLAFHITAHGFGHASRSAAVMAAIAERLGAVHFHIFSEVPDWFFLDALPNVRISVNSIKNDVGLIQKNPMEHDLEATLKALNALLPYNKENLQALSADLQRRQCKAVICDIAPMGIAAAELAKIPSFLVENFTWDWIYEEYVETHPQFIPINHILRQVFQQASFHIQTSPFCEDNPGASLTVFPVSRKPRHSGAEIRSRLKIKEEEPMVLITMGGIPENFRNLTRLKNHEDFRFVVPGGHTHYEWDDHLVLIPHHSNFYHPDLIQAADIIIGKAGYSTIAEVFQAGKPFGYISRTGFRESPPLAEFIRNEMNGIEISEADYQKHQWLDILPDLQKIPPNPRRTLNGADQIADFILEKLSL